MLRGDFRFPWEESARETSAPSVSSGASAPSVSSGASAPSVSSGTSAPSVSSGASAPSVSGGASALALLGRLFTENAVVPNKMSTFALIVRY